jgi:hypothetical protein
MSDQLSKFFILFEDIDTNAEEIIDTQLEIVEERMCKLERQNKWRDIYALVQEYKEWGTAKEGDDYAFLWLERISNTEQVD